MCSTSTSHGNLLSCEMSRPSTECMIQICPCGCPLSSPRKGRMAFTELKTAPFTPALVMADEVLMFLSEDMIKHLNDLCAE